MRSTTASPPPTAKAAAGITRPAAPTTYVAIPIRLIEDLRGSPIAIGVYALIARLYLITGTDVPLSPRDLALFDPTLSYGAGRRGLTNLDDDRYAIASAASGGKTRYRPTWGHVNGRPIPWERSGDCLGRPRHIRAVRIDDRLLDLCMGRLRPHGTHRAVVERYFTRPLLGLRDIGLYALALAGVPVQSDTLAGLGLLTTDGSPLPLPDDRTVLAVASQRAAREQDGPALTTAGWRYAGFAPATPRPPSGLPLFFVPEGAIGGVIAGGIDEVIASPPAGEGETTASGRQDSPLATVAVGSYGCTDSDRGNESSTTTQNDSHETGCGGGVSETPTRIRTRPLAQESRVEQATRVLPQEGALAPAESRTSRVARALVADAPKDGDHTTATARLLRSLGVRSDVAARLASHPVARVEALIAEARGRTNIHSLAGWVVSALRALPAADELAPPPPKVSEKAILYHRGISGYERQRWLTRFRKADPADRPAILARFLAEHPLEDSDVAAA